MVRENAPAAVASLGGIGTLGLLVQPPPVPAITPQGIPPGNPLPGAVGNKNLIEFLAT